MRRYRASPARSRSRRQIDRRCLSETDLPNRFSPRRCSRRERTTPRSTAASPQPDLSTRRPRTNTANCAARPRAGMAISDRPIDRLVDRSLDRIVRPFLPAPRLVSRFRFPLLRLLLLQLPRRPFSIARSRVFFLLPLSFFLATLRDVSKPPAARVGGHASPPSSAYPRRAPFFVQLSRSPRVIALPARACQRCQPAARNARNARCCERSWLVLRRSSRCRFVSRSSPLSLSRPRGSLSIDLFAPFAILLGLVARVGGRRELRPRQRASSSSPLAIHFPPRPIAPTRRRHPPLVSPIIRHHDTRESVRRCDAVFREPRHRLLSQLRELWKLRIEYRIDRSDRHVAIAHPLTSICKISLAR